MEIIIPITMLIGILYITYLMYKDYISDKNRKLTKNNDVQFHSNVMRRIPFCEQYWNNNGHFNREQYVKYLEAKEENQQ